MTRTTVLTAEERDALAPSDALARLRGGNARFVAGDPDDVDLLAQAAASTAGQAPFAAVLACIDSRVPVEAVVDAGVGDVFVARVAGNVVDDDVLGSLEFAAALAGVRAIVVLGHSACGAVKGACDGAELGHLTALLARITPAVVDVAGDPAPGSGDDALVAQVVERNVQRQVAALTERSDVLAGLVDDGALAITGAVYDLGTGEIAWT